MRAARGKTPLRNASAGSGYSAAFISDIEYGRRMASNEAIEKIAIAYGVESAPLIAAAARQRIAKLEEQIEELKEQAS